MSQVSFYIINIDAKVKKILEHFIFLRYFDLYFVALFVKKWGHRGQRQNGVGKRGKEREEEKSNGARWRLDALAAAQKGILGDL